MQAVLKVAPALAAGCSMVLKPAPWASLTCIKFAELMGPADIAPGALNLITGGPPGGDAGAYLGEHPDLDVLSFTGSGPTGSLLLHAGCYHPSHHSTVPPVTWLSAHHAAECCMLTDGSWHVGQTNCVLHRSS